MDEKNEGKAITENEVFVILMQVARENPSVREKILSILRVESARRVAVLLPFLRELGKEGAPQSLMDALGYLAREDVARKALEFLENG